MGTLKRLGATLLALSGFLSAGDLWARQNIVIGELSIGYDFQDRNYKDAGDIYSDEGNTRSLFASPRLRFSSRDVRDLLEFTYAPSFTYDDIDSTHFVGHDFELLAEKNVSRDWLIRATNSYFYGEDPVADYERRRSAIIPGTDAPAPGTGAGPVDDGIRELSDIDGRQRYWRNDLTLRTDYTYALDSVVGVEYRYGVLRYDEETVSGESDYDRHEGIGRLSYRFNTQWQVESEFGYVKGTYDEVDSGAAETIDDDLEEYHAMLRANYRWRPHDVYFGRYNYVKTAYEDAGREDSAIHDFTVGWDHDFSPRLSMTLSGGPSIVTYENSDSETGYNAYAGLRWAVSQHGALAVHTGYNYEFDNFDGRETGLSKTWRSGLAYDHRFTPNIAATFSGGYTRSDSEEPGGTLVTTDSDRLNYTEETYDAGLAIRYSFLRYYTLAASYRYADHSEPGEDYDEHRVLLTLTAAYELYRW